MTSPAAAVGPSAWHDVECASYAADLPLWRELAEERGAPVLVLGCGTGRVALDLARRGHEVVGLDADEQLVRALAERARAGGLPVRAHTADVRSFELASRHPLALAPMQVAQLLGGAPGRASFLAAVARHLTPGGVLALAVADPFEAVPPAEALPPLPDVLEREGWVLSSTPVEVRDEGDAVAVVRHRQAVSPEGELSEEVATIRLESVTAAALEDEGRAAGYRGLGVRPIPSTPDHVGGSVVLLEAR